MVAGGELVVLILLDALSVPPVRPKLVDTDRGRLRLQKVSQTRRMTAAQVQHRPEDVERQRMDESQWVHGRRSPQRAGVDGFRRDGSASAAACSRGCPRCR